MTNLIVDIQLYKLRKTKGSKIVSTSGFLKEIKKLVNYQSWNFPWQLPKAA